MYIYFDLHLGLSDGVLVGFVGLILLGLVLIICEWKGSEKKKWKGCQLCHGDQFYTREYSLSSPSSHSGTTPQVIQLNNITECDSHASGIITDRLRNRQGVRECDSHASGIITDRLRNRQGDLDGNLDMAIRIIPHPLAAELQPRRLVKMEYAVRGRVPLRAAIILDDLLRGKRVYPFTELIQCNIGNPLIFSLRPITYLRQIISEFWRPDEFVDPRVPEDVRKFVQAVRESSEGRGGYTRSVGFRFGHEIVKGWLLARDGFACEYGTNIYFCNGASSGINMLLEILIDSSGNSYQGAHHDFDIDRNSQQQSEIATLKDSSDDEPDFFRLVSAVLGQVKSSHNLEGSTPPQTGVFLPVPQYPLYSATIDKLGGVGLTYCLDEDDDWALPAMETLDKTYMEALNKNIHPKAIVVINPGNPTGAVLTREDIVTLICFAKKRKLVIFADEVYQDNIWSDREFYSFRRVMQEERIFAKVASFHSTSKGYYGECGVRGGLMITDNFPKGTSSFLDKLASVSLCPNITGQVAMAALCSLPKKGDESFELFDKERTATLSDMRVKVELWMDAFRDMEGITCCYPKGALYVFPKIWIPQRAVEEANLKGEEADEFYCLQLLEETGIISVPGSGFKQATGTYHLRLTILPEIKQLSAAVDRMKAFHKKFLAQYTIE